MMLWFYRLVAVPAFTISLPLLALANRKIRRGLSMRMQARDWPRLTKRPVWIHASSGEFEYAKPVIRELKTRHPEVPIVVTYFSPTFALGVENFPGVDFALPLPLDLPGPCASFIRKVNPRLLLIARTDFWPEMLTQARERGIPIRVFSYTQSGRKSRWLSRFRLNLTDEVDCVSADDRRNLETLNAKPKVFVLGDTRYDQVRFRLDHPKEIPPVLKPTLPSMVAGSTWPQDEEVLLPALTELLKNRKIQLILVPHEPTESHIADLKSQLEEKEISYALFSEQRRWNDKAVLLVDRVGVLAELYLWADYAFVGGSFRKTVHSVMEALGAGCMTFVGPKHNNNREALEFKNLQIANYPALQVVQSVTDLETKLKTALANPNGTTAFKIALKEEFNRRLGASRRLIDSLEAQL
jgi:3-deoxy-D-manno-octulosonic-acid transferase